MIKILVDSASDIDIKEAEELNVALIPMQILFNDEEFLDGINLSHAQFFEKLVECNELPKTSQINEFRYTEMFEELTKDGNDVIVITLSSKLSGTYNSAKNAAKKFNGKVFVVDSLNACIGERILCQLAIKLVKEGKLTTEQIVAELNNKKKDIKLLAVLDTLKYLKKGGRISPLVAAAGEMFSIKPVISITDGEVKMQGKAIGSKKANNLLIQLINNCGGIDFNLPYATAYSGLSDALLQKYLLDSESMWKNSTSEVPIYMIGSTIGTHIGPGGIAVAFFSKK